MLIFIGEIRCGNELIGKDHAGNSFLFGMDSLIIGVPPRYHFAAAYLSYPNEPSKAFPFLLFMLPS